MFKFKKVKREEKEETLRAKSKDLVNEIDRYLFAYCYQKKINMDKICLNSIGVIEQGNTVNISLRVGVPDILIGVGGRISTDLAKKLGKYLDRDVKLTIMM